MSLIKYFSDKKRIGKCAAGGVMLWGLSMLAPAYGLKNASAEGFLDVSKYEQGEKRIEFKLDIPIGFPGEGKNTKYNKRNKSIESQVLGLTQVSAFNSESSSSNYVVHEGNWAKTKEFGEGLVSAVTPYYNKNDGTKKWLPAWLSIGPGSVVGIPLGILASTANGVTRGINYVFNTEIGKLYSAYEDNFSKQAGVTVTAILAGLALSSGGGGGGSSSTTTTTTPAEEEEELPPEGGGDI